MSRYRRLNIERLKTLSEEVRGAIDNLSEYASIPENQNCPTGTGKSLTERRDSY
jgi:hypothetical protein